MKILKAIICDDEEMGRSAVRMTIEKYCPFVEVIGESSSMKNGIEIVNEFQPDLLFLDIDLGDGTGFDVLRNSKLVPKTIFITAHNDFAIKAFKYNAIDYILKPFNPLDLVEAIAKSVSQFELKDHNLPEIQVVHDKFDRIVVPTSNGFELINLQDIEYLEADNNYTIFFLTNGVRKTICKTLKYYDEILTETSFFRCHQSYLINTNFIKEYIKGDGGVIILKNGASIEVSRRKKEELISLINRNFFR